MSSHSANYASRYVPAQLEEQRLAKERRLRMHAGPAKVLVFIPAHVEEPPPPPPPPPVDENAPVRKFRARDIIKVVAARYDIEAEHIVGPRRSGKYIRPRQVGMYLAHERCPHLSLPQIGRAFGGRDHTTALHAICKIRAERAVNEKLDAEIKTLMADIESIPPQPEAIPIPPSPVNSIQPIPVVRFEMPPKVDITGHRYGRLVVLGFAGRSWDHSGHVRLWWNCQCDCGKTKIYRTEYLMRISSIRSCGCLGREKHRAQAVAQARVGSKFVARAI